MGNSNSKGLRDNGETEDAKSKVKGKKKKEMAIDFHSLMNLMFSMVCFMIWQPVSKGFSFLFQYLESGLASCSLSFWKKKDRMPLKYDGDLYVVSRVHKSLCLPQFKKFMDFYIKGSNIKVLSDENVRITRSQCPCIVLCLYSTRVPEDIAMSLQGISADDDIDVLLVAIQACEKTITPDLLKEEVHLQHNIITDYTDIIFSDSSGKCYECDENSQAAHEIHKFCIKNSNCIQEGTPVDRQTVDEDQKPDDPEYVPEKEKNE